MINETVLQMFLNTSTELFKLIDLRLLNLLILFISGIVFLFLVLIIINIILNKKIDSEVKEIYKILKEAAIRLNNIDIFNENTNNRMNIESTKFINWNNAIEKRLKYLEDYLHADHK